MIWTGNAKGCCSGKDGGFSWEQPEDVEWEGIFGLGYILHWVGSRCRRAHFFHLTHWVKSKRAVQLLNLHSVRITHTYQEGSTFLQEEGSWYLLVVLRTITCIYTALLECLQFFTLVSSEMPKCHSQVALYPPVADGDQGLIARKLPAYSLLTYMIRSPVAEYIILGLQIILGLLNGSADSLTPNWCCLLLKDTGGPWTTVVVWSGSRRLL